MWVISSCSCLLFNFKILPLNIFFKILHCSFFFPIQPFLNSSYCWSSSIVEGEVIQHIKPANKNKGGSGSFLLMSIPCPQPPLLMQLSCCHSAGFDTDMQATCQKVWPRFLNFRLRVPQHTEPLYQIIKWLTPVLVDILEEVKFIYCCLWRIL